MENNDKYYCVAGNKNGDIYTGCLQNGKLNEGKIRMPNGDRYIGQLKDGKPHGNGVFHKNNVDIYKGNFVNGMPEGLGCYTFSNGDIYEGIFEHGSFKEGKHYFNDGHVFDGKSTDDMKSGQGTHYHTDGSMFSGVWNNRTFIGAFTDTKGIKTTGILNDEGFHPIHNNGPVHGHTCRCSFNCNIF